MQRESRYTREATISHTSGHPLVSAVLVASDAAVKAVSFVLVVEVEAVVPRGLPGEDGVGVRLVVGLEVEHLVHVLRVRQDQPLSPRLPNEWFCTVI